MSNKKNKKFDIDSIDLEVIENIGDTVEQIESKADFNFLSIPLNLIKTNPKNKFKMVDIEKLSKSIDEFGLQHNLVVRPYSNPEEPYKYELISGERRYRAVTLLGWDKVPCKIDEEIKNDDVKAEIKLIIANLEVRSDDDMEKSENVLRLEELIKELKKEGENFEGKKTREVVADMMKIAPATVQKLKKIQELIPEFKEMVSNKEIPLETANQYAQLPTEQQLLVYNALKEGMKLNHKEAKELKDKLKQAEEESQSIIENMKQEIENKDQELNSAKTEIEAQQSKQQELLNEKLRAEKNLEEANKELSKVKEDLKQKQEDAENLKEEIKKELETELENGQDNEKIKVLQEQLQKAIEDVEQIKEETKETIKDLELERDSYKNEVDEIIDDYEKRLKQTKQSPEKADNENIINNAEITTLAKQIRSSMTSLYGKVVSSMEKQDFNLSDEAIKNMEQIIEIVGQLPIKK